LRTVGTAKIPWAQIMSADVPESTLKQLNDPSGGNDSAVKQPSLPSFTLLSAYDHHVIVKGVNGPQVKDAIEKILSFTDERGPKDVFWGQRYELIPLSPYFSYVVLAICILAFMGGDKLLQAYFTPSNEY
ncbi:MAG: hypothetical protein K2Z81_17780, partial [Cyanobacteria bacterium]|nr:hypothetical protein [Cyanobacteriota bacterium]